MSAFKAARLFSPYKVHEMKPTTAAVDELTAFPFLIGKLEDLKLELPTTKGTTDIFIFFNIFKVHNIGIMGNFQKHNG